MSEKHTVQLRDEWGNIWAHAAYGMPSPSITIGVTPLSWGIGVCREWRKGTKYVSFQIGPIACRFDFSGLGRWERCWPGHLRNRQIYHKGAWQ